MSTNTDTTVYDDTSRLLDGKVMTGSDPGTVPEKPWSYLYMWFKPAALLRLYEV